MSVRHKAEQGEGISSIAFEYGFFPTTLWDHPENKDLADRREDMDALMPGDLVFVPDMDPGVVKSATDKRHRFRRKGVPAFLEMQVFVGHTPRDDEPFRITVDGATQEGRTDDKGWLRVCVPPDAKAGTLWIGEGEGQTEIKLNVGHLDPAEEVVGLQKRLRNMGYDITDPDNELGESTKYAIADFQRRFGLHSSGEIDDETRELISDTHDEPVLFPETQED